MRENDQRLTDIEIMLAHQAEQINDLSELVQQQWREIKALKNKLSHAEDKLADLVHNLPESGKTLSATEIALRDKPPHY